MHVVAAKLTSLDPEAGAAIRVIERFDALVEGRTGVEPILRAVADITRCPVRFVDSERGIALRVDVDGWSGPPVSAPDADWLSAPVTKGGPPALWLERIGSCTLVEGMVLDRAVFAIREAIRREQDDFIGPVDVADAVSVVLDAAAAEPARLEAAHLLGLRTKDVCRVIARPGVPGQIELQGRNGASPLRIAAARRPTGSPRTGIGPAVTVLDLPKSWRQASLALAFAAEGDERDPGPSVVSAEELGTLTVLAAGLRGAGGQVPDVATLEAVAATAPWVLETLVAVVSHASLRLAAAALFVHHSTLHARLATIERHLGWPVRDAPGRLRVHLALAARRYLLHPPEITG
ncbi:PucR-like helix-turn-helix protein [Nonomuraea polychroma]|uniref:PucR-like helix-turn-helix protein n=1 Tax=Nonomuraea polychroma TaxID=46176 RepID=A0A438M5E0_9ACTN|nr:helix-turn-helix domain-containing protein [Nonomuraea polychroma]RVX40807.1 PucR-like helix-turn-helix protein [Nonomuraea polychroma]